MTNSRVTDPLLAVQQDIREAVETKRCAICGYSAKAFTDELSSREYRLSGLCQICQDEVFNYFEDDTND